MTAPRKSKAFRGRIAGEIEAHVRTRARGGFGPKAIAASATKTFALDPPLAPSSVTRFLARAVAGSPVQTLTSRRVEDPAALEELGHNILVGNVDHYFEGCTPAQRKAIPTELREALEEMLEHWKDVEE